MAIDENIPFTFSLEIDATKVENLCEIYSTYKSIICSVRTNHKVDVDGLSNYDINATLYVNLKSMKLEEANEVKVEIMPFQSMNPGLSPIIIVAGHPQYSNETSAYVWDMYHAASIMVGNSTCFTGFAVNGVSVDIEDVCRSICEFLSCKTDNVGSTDTNHNMKSWQYHIVGGYCAITIGTCVIDANILQLSGISSSIWRPIEFSSDLLVLKLALHNKVRSLYEYHISGDNESVTDFSAGEIGLLVVTFFMTKLCLKPVNSRDVDEKRRSVFSWMLMLWFTSLSVTCITTKQSLVSEAI